MFRQALPLTTAILTALGSLVAAAVEPVDAVGEKQVAVDLADGVKLKLVLVPSAQFDLGSAESAEATAAYFNKTYGYDAYGFDLAAGMFRDEHPRHKVRITKPFYLGISHVTRGQFREFVKETNYVSDAEREDKRGAKGWDQDRKDLVWSAKYSWRNTGFEQTDEHPVVNVSWGDSVAFCSWLSRKVGGTYRLPTEAEWEFACRAGTTTRYSSGNDPESLAKVGNVADATIRAKFPDWPVPTIKASDGYLFTSPAGSFKPNAFGLYDMHGNAWQWCADAYDSQYYAESGADDPTGPASDATGPASEDAHVVRGGSWLDGPIAARSAARSYFTPSYRSCIVGFRVVRDK